MDEKEKRLFYIPGDFTPARHQHYTREFLLKKYLDPKFQESRRMGFPTLADGYSKEPDKSSIYQHKPVEEIDFRERYKMWTEKCLHEIDDTPKGIEFNCKCIRNEPPPKETKTDVCSRIKRIPSTVVNALKNFELAKKLHRENLEHHPLPEVITDAMYQKLQYQRAKNPGLALKEDNFASAVAWKEYGGYGPTRCSKLKIYRPKTGVDKKLIENINERPCSVSSFDKRWRFIKKTKVTPIDLAICWDMLPVNPRDEPSREKHIDGSNGSVAPAVFQLVHNSKNIKKEQRPHTAFVPSNKEPIDVPRIQSAYYEREDRRYKSCPCLGKCQGEKSNENVKKRNVYQRIRRCGACELMKTEKREKKQSEYKMALKAGVPNNYRIDGPQMAAATRLFNPPKPKIPYKQKSYAIETLDHPFAFQKCLKRKDYPEHWRLSTIYQQSYKHPLDKRNLI